MSPAEVLSMVAWGWEQIRKIAFPESAAARAAEDVLKAIGAIYNAVNDVTMGMASPEQAKADAQKLIDSLASNDAAADAAAEAKTS